MKHININNTTNFYFQNFIANKGLKKLIIEDLNSNFEIIEYLDIDDVIELRNFLKDIINEF